MAAAARTKLERYRDELLSWEKQMAPWLDLWDKLWADWTPRRSTKRSDDDRSLSNVHIPYGFHATETILPRVVGQDPRMTYRAVDDNADAPVAAIQGGLTTWQMERMGFEYELRNFCRQGCVTGYSVAKVGWLREERQVTYMMEQPHYEELLDTTFNIEEEQTKLVVVRNNPFFETVNVHDFVWPPWAKDIDHASAVWQRRWVTKGYLRSLAKEGDKGVYRNVEDVQPDDSARFVDSRRGQFEPQRIELSQTFDYLDDEDGIVELWERWTGDELYVLASPHGNAVELREDPNPFQHKRKPFVDWSPIPHPWQLPGLGIIDIIFEQNEDLDTLRRQITDARTYILNPAWKTTEGIGQEQLSLYAGKLLEVDDLNDIEPLFIPQIDFTAAWREEQEIKQDMQRTSGAFEYLTGSSGEGSTTATEVATLTNEGNKRVAEMIKVLNERSMKRLGHFLASMNIQFIDEEVAVDFSKDPGAAQAWRELQELSDYELEDAKGKPLVNVTPEMIRAKGRLEPIPEIGADKSVNDVQRRSDATQVTTALAPFFDPQNPVVNKKAMAAYILEQFGVQKVDRDRILEVPPGSSLPPELLAALEQRPDILQAVVEALTAEQGPQQNGSSGPSGPSGENRPSGGVVGAPGAAGA